MPRQDIHNRAMTAASSASVSGSALPSMSFRLGTYNLRMSYLDTAGDNVWSVRRPRLMESIRKCAFDVAGLQEVDLRLQADLRAEFGDVYSFWFFSPYSQDGVGDKAHGIMFRTSCFEISEKRFFWTSDTPEVCSMTDVGPKGAYRRGGCCAVLTHIPSGIRFFLMCSHASYNEAPNLRYAGIYRSMESEYNPEGLPSFFVGDLNTAPDSESSRLYRSYWNDSCLAVDRSSRTGIENTYNGYECPEGRSRIDYLYYRGKGIDVRSYNCDGSLYGGLYASDHFPVTAVIRIDGAVSSRADGIFEK